jgi:hypothetical protein
MSDALAFWGEAAARTQAGELVDVRAVPGADAWHHAGPLAERLGFSPCPDSPGVYACARHASSLGLRWVGQEDFGAWSHLFRRCFDHDMSREHWDWKYRGTPRRGVGVMQGQRLVAFYGGMPRELSFQGSSWRGIQVGDVMVDPDLRGSLSRRGPFQMAASTFLEQMLGQGGPCQIGFGFPNARAMTVAQKLGLYRAVDEVLELTWPASARGPGGALTASRRADAEEACSHGDRLWRDMRQAMPDALLGVRDSRHLQWRYAQHPAHAHVWLLLYGRLSGRVLALAVCRQETDKRWEILDLVGHPNRLPALVKAAQAHVRQAGGAEVFMWMTRSQTHRLAQSQPAVRDLQVLVPTNVWVPPNHDGPLDGPWWLTGGDTDFR